MTVIAPRRSSAVNLRRKINERSSHRSLPFSQRDPIVQRGQAVLVGAAPLTS